jgi:hypothetical protein
MKPSDPFFQEGLPAHLSTPRSHAEFFEEPITYESGFHNADIVLSGDGVHAATQDGEIILVRHPNALTPGVFGKFKGRLVKARSKASIRQRRWLDPAEHARITAHEERKRRLAHPLTYRKPPPKPSKDERERLHAERELADYKAERERLAAAMPPPPPEIVCPMQADRMSLLARIATHNAPQEQGPREAGRLRAPEAERRDAAVAATCRPRKTVTAAERAAAHAMLASTIVVPTTRLRPVREKPAPVRVQQMPDDYVTPETLAAIRANERSAWSR